jgi:hypothetical protein
MGPRIAGFVAGTFASIVCFGALAKYQLLAHADATTSRLTELELASRTPSAAAKRVELKIRALES